MQRLSCFVVAAALAAPLGGCDKGLNTGGNSGGKDQKTVGKTGDSDQKTTSLLVGTWTSTRTVDGATASATMRLESGGTYTTEFRLSGQTQVAKGTWRSAGSKFHNTLTSITEGAHPYLNKTLIMDITELSDERLVMRAPDGEIETWVRSH